MFESNSRVDLIDELWLWSRVRLGSRVSRKADGQNVDIFDPELSVNLYRCTSGGIIQPLLIRHFMLGASSCAAGKSCHI